MTGVEFRSWLAIAGAATNYIYELSLVGKRATSEAVWLRHLWWPKKLNPVVSR
jgi:hypothetical protein